MFKLILSLLGITQLKMQDGNAIVEVAESDLIAANKHLQESQEKIAALESAQAETQAALLAKDSEIVALKAALEETKMANAALGTQLENAKGRISQLEGQPSAPATRTNQLADVAKANTEVTITSKGKDLLANITALRDAGWK